ncbi:hypothetical protein BGZ99_000939 [Dissophora globulifera]|uniref:Uncharacterized protein n=1 Tax=Dissophora globulifera TaxID=979702 RepID=A0A9P6RTZ5_9FUNG|nr:hypothetical protein BGZ99_000939 [Dissophora globulifera]
MSHNFDLLATLSKQILVLEDEIKVLKHQGTLLSDSINADYDDEDMAERYSESKKPVVYNDGLPSFLTRDHPLPAKLWRQSNHMTSRQFLSLLREEEASHNRKIQALLQELTRLTPTVEQRVQLDEIAKDEKVRLAEIAKDEKIRMAEIAKDEKIRLAEIARDEKIRLSEIDCDEKTRLAETARQEKIQLEELHLEEVKVVGAHKA